VAVSIRSRDQPIRKTVERLRQICVALPAVTEKLSHGEPAWFVEGKQFATTADHHDDDRLAVWLAAPDGAPIARSRRAA
jgi:hypothetical protein